MKVRFSAKAKSDLLEIGLWIAQDNPARAESFVDEIENACARLADAPRAFPLLPGHETSGIRRRPHGSYLVLYVIGIEAVEIVRILHGARDYEAVLFPEPG
jgi:toxin ParE1/3/4